MTNRRKNIRAQKPVGRSRSFIHCRLYVPVIASRTSLLKLYSSFKLSLTLRSMAVLIGRAK